MKNRPHWFRAFPTGWLSLLASLDQDEGSIANVVILRIYEVNGPLKDTPRMLGRKAAVSERRAAAALHRLIDMGKIRQTDDGLMFENCETELAHRAALSDAARENGAKGGLKTQQNQRKTSSAAKADRQPTTSELEIEGEIESKEGRKSGSLRSPLFVWPKDAWVNFWTLYPHRVGKKAAWTSFERVRKKGAVDFEVVMVGLERYRNKTDDRPWCNPTTWLNQGRWDDEPGDDQKGKPGASEGAGAFRDGMARAAARRGKG